VRRLLERFLDADTFLWIWVGVAAFWLALIVALVAVGVHFAGKYW
jgi:hypothetical protein